MAYFRIFQFGWPGKLYFLGFCLCDSLDTIFLDNNMYVRDELKLKLNSLNTDYTIVYNNNNYELSH